MAKNWKKEIARDTIALGSIPFCIIVIARAVIGEYMSFVYQLLIALPILFILSRIIKDSNPYIARCLIIVVFTSLFYEDMFYTFFAVALWLMMIVSLLYLKIKGKEISKGVLLGAISSVVSYYLTSLFV